jgi:hypothetical protein
MSHGFIFRLFRHLALRTLGRGWFPGIDIPYLSYRRKSPLYLLAPDVGNSVSRQQERYFDGTNYVMTELHHHFLGCSDFAFLRTVEKRSSVVLP